MGTVFMQCGKPISFKSENFNGEVFKLQRQRHFHWVGFLLLFHSVKRYKKGISDMFVDVLSRPIVCITTFLKHHFVLHESYVQKNTYFQYVHSSLSQRNQVEEFVYHWRHNVLYHLGKKDVATDSNMDKAKEFIERLQMVHQIMQEQLEKGKGKYKVRHEKHHVDHKFQVSDKWIKIRKVRELYPHLLDN